MRTKLPSLSNFFSEETPKTPRVTRKWEPMETKVLHILFISKLLQDHPEMSAIERNRILDRYFPEIAGNKTRSRQDVSGYWMWRTSEAKRFNALLAEHNLKIVAA